jgi:23S rRNA (uridine2552-2'-O)-methyltransferase
VGVDLSETEPLDNENVIVLTGDFTRAEICERVRKELGGEPADWVLSDAAPKLTGIRATDRANEEALLEAIEGALGALLRPGGGLLIKLLDGPEAQQVARRLKRRFAKARTVKPRATRKGSSERYLLARDFRG